MHIIDRQPIRDLTLGMLLAVIVGCGGPSGPKQPPLHPTGGIVTFDGKPLVDATVGFVPMGLTAGQSSLGKTDQNGAFVLQTSTATGSAPGTAAGQYKVVISRQATADEKPVPDPTDNAAAVDGNESLPARYSDFLNSTLTATVPDGGVTNLKFELKSK